MQLISSLHYEVGEMEYSALSNWVSADMFGVKLEDFGETI